MFEHIPLNQILYGPPGTGKTFHTINKSLEILGVEVENRSRAAIKRDFDDFVKDGRIVFCTFHQSLSYEDFIEGLKPLKPSSETNDVTYDVVPGLFKRICEDANRALQGVEVPLQNKTYSDFLQELSLKMETDGKVVLKSKSGTDVIIHNIADDELIYASPVISDQPYRNYTVSKDKLLILDAHFQSVENINNVVEDIRSAVKGVAHTYYWAVLKAFKDYKIAKKLKNHVDNKKNKNYVLIVDEINRGNVSQIFGELITLIEKDKRAGQNESLEVTLPYSKEQFSVPPNLYLIGTMNTADRSVEALDTALRRRFSFIEMPSRPELLSPQQLVWQLWWNYEKTEEWKDEPFYSDEKNLFELLEAESLISMSDENKDTLWNKMYDNKLGSTVFNGLSFTGWNLELILRKINNRLEKLLSPDHTIGHSYFMSVCSLDDLMEVIYNKIIPLLQEYFYGDFGKIGLVLGKGFIRVKQHAEDDFAQWDHDPDAIPDKDVYEILDHRLKQPFDIDINSKNEKVDFQKALNLLLNNKVEKPE
ncbi:AAA family ATPase [Mucilaginibacter sp. RB4R14]|uniref:AAA family ATPase n=1 Tax=Mucilaginibacter aurantiaciroseus TaxID=2949308 RepID=UPI0020919C76|nr:AAA family ATPase [Mucilaginibacter aurantiaciroseus]MCO5936904.1 AAA family ATPase [Mucilaginibacter aurantiaciroseus]